MKVDVKLRSKHGATKVRITGLLNGKRATEEIEVPANTEEWTTTKKVYYSKPQDPTKWDVPRGWWPAWFWFPVFKVISRVFRLKWEFYDLR